MCNSFPALMLILFCLGPVQAAETPFVVHEWGVWVRETVRVAPHDQQAYKADPGQSQSLLAAPAGLADHLPPFVEVHGSVYMPKREFREWRKPVIHMYGSDGLEVELKILTPQGVPTAYWPKPGFVENTRWAMGSGVTEAVGLVWKGTLHAAAPAGLPEAPAKHWWKTIRNVPGAYLKTENGSERFVFYEATALQEPAISARVEEDAVVLKNAHDKPSGQVLLIFNDGKEVRWQGAKGIPAGGEVSVARDTFLAPRKQGGTLTEDCERQWQSFGLTKEEAHAIVETWREDLTTRYGFLLISRMPEDLYGKMFPLTVTPRPERIVRAGAVFDTLAGQDARAAWLPNLKADLEAWAKDLRSEEYEVRAKAQASIAQTDTLAKPLLENLAAGADLESAAAAKLLLKRFEPAVIGQPLGAAAE